MEKSKRRLNSVKMMREIRDRLSIEFQGKTFAEQRQYIVESLTRMDPTASRSAWRMPKQENIP